MSFHEHKKMITHRRALETKQTRRGSGISKDRLAEEFAKLGNINEGNDLNVQRIKSHFYFRALRDLEEQPSYWFGGKPKKDEIINKAVADAKFFINSAPSDDISDPGAIWNPAWGRKR